MHNGCIIDNIYEAFMWKNRTVIRNLSDYLCALVFISLVFCCTYMTKSLVNFMAAECGAFSPQISLKHSKFVNMSWKSGNNLFLMNKCVSRTNQNRDDNGSMLESVFS